MQKINPVWQTTMATYNLDKKKLHASSRGTDKNVTVVNGHFEGVVFRRPNKMSLLVTRCPVYLGQYNDDTVTRHASNPIA